jgi:tetratricopeptide (TPR) repeat protein
MKNHSRTDGAFGMRKILLPVLLLLATAIPAFADKDPFDDLEASLLQKMPKHTAYSTMAGMLQGSGDYDKAILYYTKLLAAYAEDPGKQSAKYAWALAKTAECYESKNEPERAKEYCTESQQIMNSNKFAPIDDLYLSDARKICAENLPASDAKAKPSVVPLPGSDKNKKAK